MYIISCRQLRNTILQNLAVIFLPVTHVILQHTADKWDRAPRDIILQNFAVI